MSDDLRERFKTVKDSDEEEPDDSADGNAAEADDVSAESSSEAATTSGAAADSQAVADETDADEPGSMTTETEQPASVEGVPPGETNTESAPVEDSDNTGTTDDTEWGRTYFRVQDETATELNKRFWKRLTLNHPDIEDLMQRELKEAAVRVILDNPDAVAEKAREVRAERSVEQDR